MSTKSAKDHHFHGIRTVILFACVSCLSFFIFYECLLAMHKWESHGSAPVASISKSQERLLAEMDRTTSCLGILASTGMIPGRSWGDMTEEQKEFWRMNYCDRQIEEYGKTQCPLILQEYKIENPHHLPVEARKEWDQLLCGKAGMGWSDQSAKAIVKGNVQGKPERFPRDVAIYEPLPPWPKDGKRKVVQIVLWNQFHGFFLWHTPEYGRTVLEKCSTRCQITTNRQKAKDADAVIIHGKTHRQSDFPKVSPKTKVIFASLEQPGYVPLMNNKQYMSHFDFYTTYQLDSFMPLAAVETEWKIHEFYQPWPKLSEKKGFVAVFAGNCRNAGAEKRTKYIKELMKYIEVHSYSKCPEKNKDEFKELGVKDDREMDRKTRKFELLKRYKFYLAFENNQVLDYTSEKVFEALRAGTLPVYRGSSSIEMLLPHPKSVIDANDMNPKELATYLKLIAEDEDRYNSFFQWKNQPVKENFVRVMEHCAHNYTSMCHLCHKLSELQ